MRSSLCLPSPSNHCSATKGGRQYLLASVPGSDAAAAAQFCRGRGFKTAGTWRTTAMPTNLREQGSAAAAWQTLAPATGAVCKGPTCRAFGVIECVPAGGAPAAYDPETLNTGVRVVGERVAPRGGQAGGACSADHRGPAPTWPPAGCGNTGTRNVGHFNTGSDNLGSRNSGSGAIGDCNSGSGVVGHRNTDSDVMGTDNVPWQP